MKVGRTQKYVYNCLMISHVRIDVLGPQHHSRQLFRPAARPQPEKPKRARAVAFPDGPSRRGTGERRRRCFTSRLGPKKHSTRHVWDSYGGTAQKRPHARVVVVWGRYGSPRRVVWIWRSTPSDVTLLSSGHRFSESRGPGRSEMRTQEVETQISRSLLFSGAKGCILMNMDMSMLGKSKQLAARVRAPVRRLLPPRPCALGFKAYKHCSLGAFETEDVFASLLWRKNIKPPLGAERFITTLRPGNPVTWRPCSTPQADRRGTLRDLLDFRTLYKR